MIRFLCIFITVAVIFLTFSACRPEVGTVDKEASSGSTANVSIAPTEQSEARPGIPAETLKECMEKYGAETAVIDMLIPEQALLIAKDRFVKILVLDGITGETVLPRDSVARIEKTAIPGLDMVTVKIVDKTGKELAITLTGEDADKVEQ